MANIYKQLDCTSEQTFADSLKEALIEKFGDAVTIHYDTNCLIFSCPSISDNVIKVFRYAGYYGSSYSSGTTINDSVQFFSVYSTSTTSNVLTTAHLVLGDSFLFITGAGDYMGNIIVAKTEDGKSLVHGGTSYSNTNAVNANLTKDLTNGVCFRFVDFNTPIFCDTNVPYKTKLMMSYETAMGESLLRKSDGEVDTIKDLYMSGFCEESDSSFRATNNALFSCRKLNGNGVTSHKQLTSAIVAEF